MEAFVRSKNVLVVAVISLACCFVSGAQTPKKKKIAIYPFDDRLVAARSQSQTGENQLMGAKLAETLTTALTDSTAFEVIDRQYLERIIKEQNLKLDDRFDPQAAAKIGKLANVDAIVIGTVNNFSSNVEAKEEGSLMGKKTIQTGVVSLKVTARLISVETGSVVAAPSATTEKSVVLGQEKASNVGGFLTGNKSANSSSKSGVGNAQAALSKLVDQAVDEVAKTVAQQIDAKASSIQAAATPAVSIKVAGVTGKEVLINKGKLSGMTAGSELTVVRVVDTGIKDPDTGKSITRRKVICALVLKDIDDSSASGACSGDQPPQAGDLVEPAKK
jgi:curli biogenesis system outer membrane secretion channel CsgG